MDLCFEFAFAERSMDAPGACEATLKLLADAGLGQDRYELSGRSGTLAAGLVGTMLRAMNETFFSVDGERMSYRCGHDSLRVFFKTDVPALGAFDQWVSALAPFGGALYGRLYDWDWERRQNDTQLSAYASRAGFRTKWDPDFEQEIVDTSFNPGRRVHRDGYTEALGHEMWLMPAFWPITGADRSAVAAKLRARDLDAALAVTLAAAPFDDEKPPSEAIRRLLFP